jgi:hypothetical protein
VDASLWLAADQLGETRNDVGNGGRHERERVRQDRAVRVCVREVVRAAQHVADLVVDPGSCRAERRAREVRRDEHVSPGVEVVWLADDARQAVPQEADPLLGEDRRDRVCRGRVHRLDAMREGVHAGGGGDTGRQREGQDRVVDDDAWLYAGIAAGLLAGSRREPPDRCRLGSGVCRRHRHDRHVELERHGLGKPGGRAASDRDDDVGRLVASQAASRLGVLERHVHADLVDPRRQPRPEVAREVIGPAPARAVRHEQDA